MEVETRDTDEGTEITVYTDERVALSVRTGREERIYLPGVEGDDSTYYADSPNGLTRVEEGYRVVHRGRIERIEVLH